MSLMSRHSPRRTRAKKDKPEHRVGETQTPTLGPVVEKIETVDTEIVKEMIEDYKYKSEPIPEPQQLNRSVETDTKLSSTKTVKVPTLTFGLYDLSFFCEERIYNLLWLPQDIKTTKIRDITQKNIQNKLNIYSEYSREVTIGSFKDTIHFYNGEVLIPEEFLNISGFMRKFLDIERVHVLYETGEILQQDTGFCNYWMKRAQGFFEPRDVPRDSPKIQDEDVCLDCNLKCVIRHRQQMIN